MATSQAAGKAKFLLDYSCNLQLFELSNEPQPWEIRVNMVLVCVNNRDPLENDSHGDSSRFQPFLWY